MAVSTLIVPRETDYVEGVREQLTKIKGAKAIVVTESSSMKAVGFQTEVERQLSEGGFETAVFDGVDTNPSVEIVRKGAKAMLDFEPDWIVAVGGRSVIETVKVMWRFYEHPYITFHDIISEEFIQVWRRKAKFAAVYTPSGSASEVTAFPVITDTENHIKYPIDSTEIVPDMTILDATRSA